MRFIIRPILTLLLILGLAACAGSGAKKSDEAAAAGDSGSVGQDAENPYTKSYVNKGRPSIALQPDATGPKIYRGESQVEDYKRMLENGFDMLGYSSFQGTDVKPEQATEQAKNIKADMVLLYAKKKGSAPLSVQLEQARKKASDAAKRARNQDAPISSDNSAPEDQALYEYFASYWVKLAPPLIGVHVEANTQDDRRFGLRVVAVVKGSPAAKAAIQEEDVLTRIGDIAMDKPETLTQAAKRYAGQTVDVLYKRGDSNNKTTMTINKRL